MKHVAEEEHQIEDLQVNEDEKQEFDDADIAKQLASHLKNVL